MEDENKVIDEVVEEIKNTDEEKLKEVISKWFEQTRTEGMRIGAYYISAGVYAAIKKNTSNAKPTLRDYKRAMKDILNIVSIQLKTKQSDSEEKADDSKE